MSNIGFTFCRLSRYVKLSGLQISTRCLTLSTSRQDNGAKYFLKLQQQHSGSSVNDDSQNIKEVQTTHTNKQMNEIKQRFAAKAEVLDAVEENRSREKISIDEITELDSTAKNMPGPLTSELNEDIDEIGPAMAPTFNFAAYINDSSTLKQLLKLGVDLHKIEKHADREVPTLVLNLDFDRDVKPIIEFFNKVGVPIEELGKVFTKNPKIFSEHLNNLQLRINYLKSKNFSDKAIAKIIHKAPFWLTMNTREVDRRLGIIQKMFSLTGNEVRSVISQCPKLVTFPIDHIKVISFTAKEEMGFTVDEMKSMFLSRPKVWLSNRNSMRNRFNYLHNTMGLTHQQIVQFPDVLRARKVIVQQRHMFLEHLGRVQYNAEKPNYISVKDLISCSDGEFCLKYAKKSVKEFNAFLKTL